MSFDNHGKVDVTEPYGWYCAMDPGDGAVNSGVRDIHMGGGCGTKGRGLF